MGKKLSAGLLGVLALLLMNLSAFAGTWPNFSNGNGGDWSADYYKRFTVTNDTGGTLTNYQLRLTLNTALLGNPYANINENGSDLRFTQVAHGDELPYCIESFTNTNAAPSVIWVKFASLPAGTSDLYMYYGNTVALSSSTTAVFDFFEDFPGPSINPANWTISSTGFTIEAGELKGINTNDRLTSLATYSAPVILEAKTRSVAIGTYGTTIAGFWNSTADGFTYLQQTSADYIRYDGTWSGNLGDLTSNNVPLLTTIRAYGTWVDVHITNLNTGARAYGLAPYTNTVSGEKIMLGQRADDLYLGEAYEIYWDWIRVRQCAFPEPSVQLYTPPFSGGTFPNFSNDGGGTWNAADYKTITVYNPGGALTDYPVRLTLHTAGLGKPYENVNFDGSDVRFTRTLAGDELPYWIESWNNEGNSVIWVKVPDLPPGNSNLYFYYGNFSATSSSNPNYVFFFFDDFSGTTIDDLKWVEYDTTNNYLQQGDVLFATGGPGSWGWTTLCSRRNFNRADNLLVEWDYKWTGGQYFMFGWKDPYHGSSYTDLVYAMYNNAGTGTDDVYEDNQNRGDRGTWSANTQYKVRLKLKASGGCLYQRSVDGGKNWSTWYDSAYSTETPLKIGMCNHNQTFQVDNLLVRKWVSAEPTATLPALSFTYPNFSKGGGGNWAAGEYKTLYLSNFSGQVLTNHQVKVTLNSTKLGNPYANIQSDGSDIRFSQALFGNQLPHWIESWDNTGTSVVWVKVPTIPRGYSYLYLYHGNTLADDASDIQTTMEEGLTYYYYSGRYLDTLQGSDIDTFPSYAWSSTVSIKGNSWENLADTVSIRWKGWVVNYGVGNHKFFISLDDGGRLYVNNNLIINQWTRTGGETEFNGTVYLDAPATITFDWNDNTGGTAARLGWQPALGAKTTPIPAAYLRCCKAASPQPTADMDLMDSTGTFIEDFTTTDYKDGTNTTGQWHTADEQALLKVDHCGDWTPMNLTGAPDGRYFHDAVWTGPNANPKLNNKMIIWGGWDGTNYFNTGGIYDLETDTWTTMSASPLSGRWGHTCDWKDSKLVVWGGLIGPSGSYYVPTADGAVYDPDTDTWSPMAASPLEARGLHGSVTTENDGVIIALGYNGSTGITSGKSYYNGACYYPATNTWVSIASCPLAKVGRIYDAVCWTGQVYVFWGGATRNDVTTTGSRYNPSINTWANTSASPMGERWQNSVIWTGSRVIFWGGRAEASSGYYNTGAQYDPVGDTWQATTTSGAPAPRYRNSAVWTGSLMIVYGGTNAYTGVVFDDGAAYDPATDSWAPIPSSGVPVYFHNAVWTGPNADPNLNNKMLIWGGAPATNAGFIFDPSKLYYVTSSIIQSTRVNKIDAKITAATLSVTDTTTAEATITYQLSPDGGVTWYTVTPGAEFVFPVQGTDLRWRATLATTDTLQTPSLQEVRVDYKTGPRIITAGWSDLTKGRGSVKMGQSIPYIKFEMQMPVGSTRWKHLRIDKVGPAGNTVPDDKIEVQAWAEDNNNNTWDAEDYLIARGNFVNGVCGLKMNRYQVTTTTRTIYIVLKLSQGISGGQQVGVKLGGASYLEFEDSNIAASGIP